MYKQSLVFFSIILINLRNSDEASTPDSPTYVAGVVEFKPDTFLYSNETSAPDYARIIQSSEAAATDILVFPEMTLNTVWTTTYVPEPDDRIVPCGNDFFEEFLSSISCSAKQAKKYVVVNIIEKANCTAMSQAAIGDPRPCSSKGLNHYNTNVVFDRNGTVISRYRKWNLYGEMGRNTTYKPEFGVFDTDFGVRFGHFICFDILFYIPAEELVSRGIKDFIFPTMWFSELPFLTAAQVQSSWSYANNVTLLAAGANNAAVGSTGTGIYVGRQGPIETTFTSDPVKKLIVATVPKANSNIGIPSQPKQNSPGSADIYFKRDRIENYNTSLIVPSEQIVKTTLCQNDLCCKFMIVVKNQTVPSGAKSYSYRFAVYDGNRSYSENAEGSFKICGIISCLNETLASCGKVFSKNESVVNSFSFEAILIEGDFRDPRMMFFMPNSLDFNFMALDKNEWYLQQQKFVTYTNALYALSNPRQDILTFAIYVNILDKPDSPGSASSIAFGLSTIIIPIVAVVYRLEF